MGERLLLRCASEAGKTFCDAAIEHQWFCHRSEVTSDAPHPTRAARLSSAAPYSDSEGAMWAMCFSQSSVRRAVENRALCMHGVCVNVAQAGDPRLRMAGPDTRCLSGELRAAGWLCFQNEYSDVVWYGLSRLFYKAFAEAKRCLWISI